MDKLEKILNLLVKALTETSFRKETVEEIIRSYLENELLLMRSISGEAFDILAELAYDLDFFVADPSERAQDPSYYGDERLVKQIATALARLAQAGIAIPNGRPAHRG